MAGRQGFEQGMPHDATTERAILGAVQLNNDLISEARDQGLSVVDFHKWSNQRIFKAIDEQWVQERITSGLSSGEGLLYAVRDASEYLQGELAKRNELKMSESATSGCSWLNRSSARY